MPSQTHELVRNIAASPLLTTQTMITELDRALCADPALAALPGRFQFAIDSGAGDVAFSADVSVLPDGGDPDGDDVVVLFAGRDAGLRVPPGRAVEALLAAARAFVRRCDEAVAAGKRRPWRVRELADGAADLAAETATALGVTLSERRSELRRPALREPIGIIERGEGRADVAALIPLGVLSRVPMEALEAAERLVVTPWRGIVVADVPVADAQRWARQLAGAGLEVAAGSRWIGVTACAGRPGCHNALADVRHDAGRATTADDGLPVHWLGCQRGCGSPATEHVRVEATGDGYRVSRSAGAGSDAEAGVTVTAGEIGGVIAAARKG
jgi:precorrin-3B synthase